jgi:signal transduction histidine kinase
MAQAQRAHRMLRDLIYIARPPQPRPRRCQPDAVLREVAADLRREAADRRVQLRIRIAPEPVAAWAEPDHLRHLADALLRNALEATPPGQSVRVVGRSRPGALDWTITDRGRGLTDHEARCLFDPFFSGREAGRGLGLGLSRAARFVELQGGQIRWQSTSGRGTTFSVRIPLPTRDPTPPPAVPPPPHFAPRPSPTTGAG